MQETQETWVWSLGGEMATHSSILAWEIPWIEEPGGLESKGSQWVGHDWAKTRQEERANKIFSKEKES